MPLASRWRTLKGLSDFRLVSRPRVRSMLWARFWTSTKASA